MQTPYRKPGKYNYASSDPHMTRVKFDELQNNLKKLNKYVLPKAREEVERLAALGDFSDNAEYQIAKGRLRALNRRAADLEQLLARAEIIPKLSGSQIIEIGSVVTIKNNEGQENTYQILGSSETDPSRGIVSHHSPLGQALLNKSVGDEISMKIGDRIIKQKIIKIN